MALEGNVAARTPGIQERSISPPRTLGIQGQFQEFSLVVEKCNRGPHSARGFAAEGRHGDTVWEIFGVTSDMVGFGAYVLAVSDLARRTGGIRKLSLPVTRLKGDRPILDSKRLQASTKAFKKTLPG